MAGNLSDLRGKIMTAVACIAAAATGAASLTASSEVERLQCLCNVAEESVEEALSSIDELLEAVPARTAA